MPQGTRCTVLPAGGAPAPGVAANRLTGTYPALHSWVHPHHYDSRLPGLHPLFRTTRAVLFCLSTLISPALGDYITDELDRQWSHMQQKIADEPIGCMDFNEGGPQIVRPIQEYLRGTRDEILDEQSLILEADRDPLDIVVRRTRALLNYLKTMPGVPDVSEYEQEFATLKSRSDGVNPSNTAGRKELYYQVCAVRRSIAFSNPLLDFDEILVGGGMTEGGIRGHLSVIAWAVKAKYGNWMKIIENPFSSNPTARNILAQSVFENGPRKGEKIMDLGGAFNHPCLSYDGQSIFFAWVETKAPGNYREMFEGAPEDHSWGIGIGEEYVYHIYKVNVDGTNLTQLTFGLYNDAHPWQLPNGRIVFVSTRRPGNDRCVANKSNTLCSMNADGSDIIQLSFHETHEWYPCVDNNGMIIYTRWDYVDKGADEGHHLWTCYPDGTDPRAPHGNYPHPRIDRNMEDAYAYFDYTEPDYRGYRDGRHVRPYIEFLFRPIPDSRKLVCVAGRHHGNAIGPLMIVDPEVEDDGLMSQAKRITPYLYPEGEGSCPDGYDQELRPDFSAAWPLSEDFYLTSWGNTLLLLDRFGNREPLYTDNMRPNLPTPVRARKKPPVLATRTHQGENADPNHYRATLNVQNVYNTYPFWFPPEVVEQKKVKWLRIVQVFPRMNHTDPDDPDRYGQRARNVSYSPNQNCRMSLGIVPVEEDGSVYCEAPVNKCIYFQALDENHMAIHSMRSATYVHPGEQLSCVGCHESKWKSIPPGTPRAMQRPPSKIQPEFEGGPEPMNYHRLVKPIFENTCIPCHTEENSSGIKDSDYRSFLWSSFHYPTGMGAQAGHGSMTAPGFTGASACTIGKALKKSHRDRLADDEWNRVILWLDLNSMEFGSDYDFEKQRAGELVWPVIDVDSTNPRGVEIDQPSPGIPDTTHSGSAKPADARTVAHEPKITIAGNRIIFAKHIRYSGPVKIRVTDVRGRTMMRKGLTGNNTERAIQLTGMSTGIFSVVITTPRDNFVRRIVVAQ